MCEEGMKMPHSSKPAPWIDSGHAVPPLSAVLDLGARLVYQSLDISLCILSRGATAIVRHPQGWGIYRPLRSPLLPKQV